MKDVRVIEEVGSDVFGVAHCFQVRPAVFFIAIQIHTAKKVSL